jgi:cytochrome P450
MIYLLTRQSLTSLQSGAARTQVPHPTAIAGPKTATEGSLAAIDHSLHKKLRRSALNPFYSTQTVRELQPVVEERVEALLDAFLNYAEVSHGQPLDVMYPYSAFTNGESIHLSVFLQL